MFDLARKVGARGLLVAVIAAGAVLIPPPANAQYHGGFHGGYHGGWHGGGWHHHGGWGWGVGIGVYDPWWPGYYAPYPYYDDPPVTVIQQPPVTVVQPPMQAAPPSYYYCDNPGGYYPYVQQCSLPWRQVPAQPAAPPPPHQ